MEVRPALRAFREGHLPFLERLSLDPAAVGPFMWTGFKDPMRQRGGLLRGAVFRQGARQDMWIYGLLREDVRGAKARVARTPGIGPDV